MGHGLRCAATLVAAVITILCAAPATGKATVEYERSASLTLGIDLARGVIRLDGLLSLNYQRGQVDAMTPFSVASVKCMSISFSLTRARTPSVIQSFEPSSEAFKMRGTHMRPAICIGWALTPKWMLTNTIEKSDSTLMRRFQMMSRRSKRRSTGLMLWRLCIPCGGATARPS